MAGSTKASDVKGYYSSIPGPRPGQISGLDKRFETKLNPSGGVAFKFGVPVFVDTGVAGADETAFHGDHADESLVFLGVSAIKHYIDKNGVGDCYPALDQVEIAIKGRAIVAVPATLADTHIANLPVFAISLTTDGDYEKFTNAAGTNAVATGAVFVSDPVLSFDGLTYVAEIELKGRV